MIDLRKGDCLEVMKSIPDGSIDAIITDPPYGTTACKWDSVIPFELMWEQLNRIIKPNGAIVLFGSEPFSSALRMSNVKNYKYDWIWKKPKGTGFLNAKKQPLRYTEVVSVFYRKQCTYNPQKTKGHKPSNISSAKSKKQTDVYGKFEKQVKGGQTDRYPKNIVKFNNVNSAKGVVHPTQKPVALMEYLIKTYTNNSCKHCCDGYVDSNTLDCDLQVCNYCKGSNQETVLDFTMGSGSTMVACQNLNRNGIGIEMDNDYFDIAQQRIKENEYKLF